MSHCSQCGRYVGPYEACPYCGAQMTGRLSIRAVKGIAVALASVGLVVLWLLAIRSPVPLISIGQADATTHMAYARVEGWVVDGPDYYPDSGTLSFTVSDGTGEIRVSLYRKEAETMRAQARIPALGDRVSVAGTLRVREEGISLTVNVPESVEIVRPEAVMRQIGSITAADYLLRVRVRGQVWEVYGPGAGLTVITLRDQTGAVALVLREEMMALAGTSLSLEPGQSVEVVGTVDLYQGQPQIVPASVLDVVLLSDAVPVAHPVAIAALETVEVGQLVEVEGRVIEASASPAGMRLTLEDGSGTVTIFLYQDLVSALGDSAAMRPGAQVRVVGKVALYRGVLEVVPERPMDVQRLEEGRLVERAVIPWTPLAELLAMRGEIAAIQGEVVEVSSFASGFRFTLDDGSAQAVLLLWLPVYAELADPALLDRGAWVQATGVVAVYEGETQVVPGSGLDVIVVSPGAAGASEREIGSLTAEDVGAVVAIEGAVTRAESFSGGWRLWVGDGTGAVVVLLWDTVCDRVPGGGEWVPGLWVRVVGQVEMYEGVLEVVPRLPHDVEMADER